MPDADFRPLDVRDHALLEGWFRADPVEHCYLQTQLEKNGLSGFYGLGRPLRTGVFLRPGRLMVPFGRVEGARELGRAIASTGMGLRYVVGPLELTDAVWGVLGRAVSQPLWSRRNFVYALDPEHFAEQERESGRNLQRERESGLEAGRKREPEPHASPERGRLRHPVLSELGWLIEASSRMDREDRGVDPLEEDAAGLEQYLIWLIQEGLVYVWEENGRLLFKAQAACSNHLAALVEGVYTVPEARGRGVAVRAMCALAGELLPRTSRLALYVNEQNEPAIRLYERVGYRRVSEYRSILFRRQVMPASIR